MQMVNIQQVKALEEEDFMVAVEAMVEAMEEAEVVLTGNDSPMNKIAIRVIFNVTTIIDMGILKQFVGSKIRR